MSELSQAACSSCARRERKPPHHIKLTSVFKIWQTWDLCDMETLCLAAQKGVLLSAITTLCGFQLLDKEQGNLVLDRCVEIFRSQMSGNCT